MAEEVHFNHHKLSTQILVALVLGVAAGLLINFTVPRENWFYPWIVNGVFKLVGDVFIRLLTMLIVPIVFVSLVSGTGSLADPKSLGRIGAKVVGLYLFTTGVAVVLALGAGALFKTGVGTGGITAEAVEIAEAPPFMQVLLEMTPANPVQSMAEGNMLQVIVFSILLGLAMSFSGKAGERVGALFNDLMEVVMKLVGLIMLFAPYGVFALVANTAANTGWETFAGLIKYVVLVLCVLLFHAFVVYSMLLKTMSGLSPLRFFEHFREVLAFAFSTASSGATIPVTLKAVQENMGVSNRVSAFTIPLGATINMDGTAIMQGIAVGFIAQHYGIELALSQYAMVTIMVILASIGTAGVPGVGLIMLAGVLAQVNLPAQGIALILGVDRLLDMVRTAVNVTGDTVVTCIVAKGEGEMNVDVYNGLVSEDQPAD